jgi:hypothetical protein
MIENPRTCELGKGRTGILIFYSFRAGLLAFVFLVVIAVVDVVCRCEFRRRRN